MVKKKEKENKKEEILTSIDLLKNILNDGKADHYNFEETIDTPKVSSGSINFDRMINGGLGAGCIRMIGETSGGKTSQTLEFTFNFLNSNDGKKRKALYIKSEGRLSKEMMKRSGVRFVSKAEDWVEGTCFIVESNVYEFVFSTIKQLIENNEEGIIYYFIIDSMDTLCKREDLAKPFEESNQVAGGSLLTAKFFQKCGLALSKRGHTIFFISQKRATIEANGYVAADKKITKQGTASGGYAVQHQSDWVLEFQRRFEGDLIRSEVKDPKEKGTIVGHNCRIKILKSDNEKNGFEISYPIKYGQSGANSIWLSREIVDILLSSQMITRAGAWFNFDPYLLDDVRAKFTDIEFPEKIQGINAVYTFFENNANIAKYLATKEVDRYLQVQ